MTTSYACSNFSLELPDKWNVEERRTNWALFRIDVGRGAINISTVASASKELDNIDSLFTIFSNIEVGKRVADFAQIGIELVFGESNKGPKYWQYWVFRRANFALFASYNCLVEHLHSSELEEVNQIVRSIRLRE